MNKHQEKVHQDVHKLAPQPLPEGYTWQSVGKAYQSLNIDLKNHLFTVATATGVDHFGLTQRFRKMQNKTRFYFEPEERLYARFRPAFSLENKRIKTYTTYNKSIDLEYRTGYKFLNLWIRNTINHKLDNVIFEKFVNNYILKPESYIKNRNNHFIWLAYDWLNITKATSEKSYALKRYDYSIVISKVINPRA